jgi:hypothetical protein
MTYHALSVRQPFATYIASGQKSVEFRSWQTRYRGELVIVSGARPHAWPAHRAAWLAMRGTAPLGVTVAIVELVRIVPFALRHRDLAMLTAVDMSELRGFAWILRNARRLKPRGVKGRLQIFDLPDALVALAA